MNDAPNNYMKILLDKDATIIEFNCSLDGINSNIDVVGKNWFDNFIDSENKEEIIKVFKKVLNDHNLNEWKTHVNPIKIDNNMKVIEFRNQTLIKNGERFVHSLGIEHNI